MDMCAVNTGKKDINIVITGLCTFMQLIQVYAQLYC